MNNVLLLILNVLGLILIITWIVQVIKSYKSHSDQTNYFTFSRFKNPIAILLIAGIPFVFFNYSNIALFETGLPEETVKFLAPIMSILASLTISGVWMIYVWKLDIFEKEKFKHLLIVFLLSAFITDFFCIPMYRFVESFGFNLNGNPVNDFFYCMFVIGGIEEIVKLVPVLLILRYTKAVNEPYDYLLYASVSALGFAFAENIMYISKNYANINGRLLYAAVAHMTFSSTIMYGMLLAKYKLTKIPKLLVYLFFFGIAIFSHGFYDFWLINNWASQYSVLTTVFFLITIHIWFTMKNNAINITTFYNPNIKFDNKSIQYFLIIGLVSVFMLSYTVNVFFTGLDMANVFLKQSVFFYAYLIYYLVMSFSRFKVMRGYFLKFQVGFNIIIPRLIKITKKSK